MASQQQQPVSPPRKPLAGPELPPSDSNFVISPMTELHFSPYNRQKRASLTFRQVQRVSKRAALASKAKIWDSNDASIDAAQTAVDHWEATYNALRGLLVATAHSAHGLYGAAKTGATGLEHGLLVPVRDWILLPAFMGVERLTGETVGFLQSPQATQVADGTLDVVRKVPFVGDNILAPALVNSVQLARTAWRIAQYPIPSKADVRDSVDFAMTGTKWALSTAGREIYFYARVVDANITRTLMHTQWKVLGSGPYATLDKVNKLEVIDHLCERYFSLEDDFARYELAAHIRAHNRILYQDLVLTGLLRERGGDLTRDDEWLSFSPSYRSLDAVFLLPKEDGTDTPAPAETVPLWFRLPYQNGKRPGRDVPWVRLTEGDKLEQFYLSVLSDAQDAPSEELSDRKRDSTVQQPPSLTMDPDESASEKASQIDAASCPPQHASSISTEPSETDSVQDCRADEFDFASYHTSSVTPDPSESDSVEISHPPSNPTEEKSRAATPRYPTVAQWYEPDTDTDILVDQKRHAVSFLRCCPRCRISHYQCKPPLVKRKFGTFCDECQEDNRTTYSFDTLFLPPPLTMVMRPTMWRFHGPGDDIRRAVWFLDTKRHGLQPYSEESAAVLEDAYLFLKWKLSKTTYAGSDEMNGEILTVQVPSPDGAEQQLVQFRSLTQVTAIQKTLGGAISLFKRRVYRGALRPGAISDVSPEEVTLDTYVSADSHIQGPEVPSEKDPLDPSVSADADIQGFEVLPQESPLKASVSADSDIRGVENDNLGSSVSAATDETTETSQTTKETNDLISTESLAVPASLITEPGCEASVVDDVDDENIEHLVLIVHGIGEMLRSVDLFGLSLPTLSSIVECVACLRENHDLLRAAQFVDGSGETMTGRVEYIPVEWHEAFALQSQRLPMPAGSKPTSGNGSSNTTINDISLKTIPQMREFANDTLMDVLYFMSPDHHDKLIDIVTSEMEFVVSRFRNLTGFDGKISVIGHSLGSIIAWDILANQLLAAGFPEQVENSSIGVQFASRFPENSHLVGACPGDVNRQMTTYPQLSFPVENAFMLGSPIAVFLMIRNQHRLMSDEYFLSGCSRVFNIFHPYDPVAYRIEPLIDPRNADFEPRIIPRWTGGFRVQYQTKILWKKFVDETWKTQQTVLSAVEAGISGLLDPATDISEDEEELSEVGSDENQLHHVKSGKLNQGRRVDYMLQEKEIENANEYVAALNAHSSYWVEKDLSLFFARQIHRSANETDDHYGHSQGRQENTPMAVDAVEL